MLQQRLMTALALIAVFLGALFLLPDFYWAMLLLAIAGVGAWEWSAMARQAPPARHAYVALVAASGLLLLPGAPGQQAQSWALMAAALFWLLPAPYWLFRRSTPDSAAIMAVVGWLVLMPAWLALVGLRRVSPLLVLALMANVWIADTAAYYAGRRFGRHKLAPQISPGKTWEGVAGAMAATALYAAALAWLSGGGWWIVPGALGITALSIVGDLFESLVKRQAGVKDSGAVLPGHGGVLDRIDGLTSTLPLAALAYASFPACFPVAGDG